MILHLDLPAWMNAGGLIVLPLLVITFCLAAIAARKPEPTDADYEGDPPK